MKSHDLPSATSSKTCHTMIRVPLKVGLPWQMRGSATMYSPSSIGAAATLDLSAFFTRAVYTQTATSVKAAIDFVAFASIVRARFPPSDAVDRCGLAI